MTVNTQLILKPKIGIPLVLTALNTITYIHEVNSIQSLEVTIPPHRISTGEVLNKSHLTVGTKVIFRRGYDNDLQTRFVGYIADVSDDTPYIITCYDLLYFGVYEDCGVSAYENMSSENIIKAMFPNWTVINYIVSPPVVYPDMLGKYTKSSVLKTLANAEKFHYYIDEFNRLILSKPFTRAQSRGIINLNDRYLPLGSKNVKEAGNQDIKVRVNSFYTKKDKEDPSPVVIGNGKVVYELFMQDVDAQTMYAKAIEYYNELAGISLNGNLTLFGDPIVFVGNYFFYDLGDGDIRQIEIERVEEIIDIGIRQNLGLRTDTGAYSGTTNSFNINSDVEV